MTKSLVRFMARQPRLRDSLQATSALRYFAWKALGRSQAPVSLRMKTGQTILLRPRPAGDLDTAYEIFAADIYRPPRICDLRDIRFIVDLGANVGYALLYFAALFPKSKIEAYEPHPEHLRQLRRQVAGNSLDARVQVRGVAASNRAGKLFLTDKETQSKLTTAGQAESIPVEVVDWLDAMKGRSIDFLKMDVEGAEREILTDRRFPELQIRNLVVEWHAFACQPDARAVALGALESAGFRIQAGPEGRLGDLEFGLVWGSRQ